MTLKLMISKKMGWVGLLILLIMIPAIPTGLIADTASVGSTFSYQGQLTLNGNLVNDSCDLTFALYDAESAGNQVGSTLTKSAVTVTDGLFTVELDFAANTFTGDSRWLEIAVKCSGDSSFTTLAPRQALNPTPYAMYADEAGGMSFSNLSDVPAGLADGDNDTTYSVGTGLSVSGNAFSLVTAYRLPQSCSNNQVAKWDGSAWACADDNDTDTNYSAGTGIELSSNAFSVESGYQLPQSCNSNQVPKWNGSAWACADDNNTYTAGNGLTLSNNEFSANFGDAASTTAEGNHTHPANDIASGTVDDARLSADVTHRNVAETISADWDNTANPWADNEVADNLTISGGTIDNSVIGNTTAAAANVTDLSATGNTTLGDASTDQITVNGALKITSGSPGAGKVLTSDADGDATWQNAPDISIGQVINVAKSGGDYTSIQAALLSITDASASKPYLIRVAPGVYEEQVTMKAHVDIEGAGESQTIIKHSASASTMHAVAGSDNAEIRFISVECNANANETYGIYNSSASPTITHVTVTASGGTDNRGIYNNSASPIMKGITASASGGTDSYGIYNHSSSPTMQHVTASASGGTTSNYGIRNTASSPMMKDVSGTASGGANSYGIYNEASSSPTINYAMGTASGGSTINVGLYNNNSSPILNHITASGSGGNNSYGVYNLNSSSLTMKDVMASASDATTNYGLFNSSSSPTINHVMATASGGTTSYGLYNSSASPTINNSVVSASGATTDNYGMLNNTSSPTINNMTATASGGTNNRAVSNQSSSSPIINNLNATASDGSSYGVYNDNASAATISASQVKGGTNSIVNNSGSAKVANSTLDGTVSGGSFTCFSVYDASFAALNGSCQ